METIDTPKIDKSTWGPGEWQDEPDREDWVAHGFACFVLRHDRHGHFCGYVGVPREHALYGKAYDQIHTLQAHGDVNYAAACSGHICHVPAEGMPEDVWWIGFDCGQTWDKSPGRDARLREAADANRAHALRVSFPASFAARTIRATKRTSKAARRSRPPRKRKSIALRSRLSAHGRPRRRGRSCRNTQRDGSARTTANCANTRR